MALDLYRSRPLTGSILVFPLLIAAIPLLDAAFAVLRRLRQGLPVLNGDRFHSYDLLASRGWKTGWIAVTFYGLTALFAAIALSGVPRESHQFWIFAGCAVGVLIFATVRLGSLRGNDQTAPTKLTNSKSGAEERGELTSTD